MIEQPEIRHTQPIELLTDIEQPKSHCHHCKKGIVEILRDSYTFELRWDCVYCLLCGQRYRVAEEDRERFLGHDPKCELFGKLG